MWTTPAQVNQTKFALDVGNGIITYYEEYYNLGYPLPKQGLCLSVLALQRYLIITIVNKSFNKQDSLLM